jgi:S1-C subfamily serine protease
VSAYLRRGLPFASGVLAALLAMLIYNLTVTQPEQLTVRDVRTSIVEVMASATAPPSYSSQVYQVIRPSLILVQVERERDDDDERSGYGLGSGVVFDNFGNILTSLHVITGASQVTVTFADGTESPAEVVMEMPEYDLAVLQAYRWRRSAA